MTHYNFHRWILRPEDAKTRVCQTVNLEGDVRSVNVSTTAPVGTSLYKLTLTTFPEGVRQEKGKTHSLDCDCPTFHPPPHGGLVPIDLAKPAFTNPVQTMIYLHYQWNMAHACNKDIYDRHFQWTLSSQE